MKRTVTLYLRKMDSDYKLKIVIEDMDYGNMDVCDCISIDLDEGTHEIQGIILTRNGKLGAIARFKIGNVEASIRNMFYYIEVENTFFGWEAKCFPAC